MSRYAHRLAWVLACGACGGATTRNDDQLPNQTPSTAEDGDGFEGSSVEGGRGGASVAVGGTSAGGNAGQANVANDLCTTFEPCGGDPVGKWVMGGADCLSESVGSCDAVVSDLSFADPPLMEFYANGRFRFAFRGGSISQTYSMQPICVGGVDPTDCSEVEKVSNATCSWSASKDCACVIRRRIDPVVDVGTWSVSGHALELVYDVGGPETNEFCRRDGQLDLVRYSDGWLEGTRLVRL